MGIENIRRDTAGLQNAIPRPMLPTTSAECINVLAHYHRAEVARMAGWRDRIDRTTNWSITVVGAMLSVSLSTPTAHHGVMLFAMLLVLLLLVIESRRYRFFDVYRGRVRRLERSYYAQVLSPTPGTVEDDWALVLAEDLRKPMFGMSRGQAFARRLRRNYGWMFAILFLAWLLKISLPKMQPGVAQAELALSPDEWLRNAALGPVPGWMVIVAIAGFNLWLLYAALRPYKLEGEFAHGDVHV
jgi:uncharacterized membrane protein